MIAISNRTFSYVTSLLLGLTILTPTGWSAPADDWAKQLGDADLSKRREAAYALADLGDKAAPALDALVAALDDRDEQVWFQSITAIANIGPKAAGAVDQLVKDLDGDNRRYKSQVALRTALALGKIGAPALPALTDKIRNDNDALARANAARAVSWLGEAGAPAIDALKQRMYDDDENVRREVGRALAMIGPAGSEAALEALNHKNARVRHCALIAVSEMDNISKKFGPPLLEIAKSDPDSDTQAAALKLLPLAIPMDSDNSKDAAESLLKALSSPEPELHNAALTGMLRAKKHAESAFVPGLISLLRHDDKNVRVRATNAVARLGWHAASATPTLISALETAAIPPDHADTLHHLGPEAFAPLLDHFARKPGLKTADNHWALVALKALAPYSAASLRKALRHEAPAHRYLALRALDAFGKDLRDFRRPVLNAANSDQTALVTAALPLLQRVGVPKSRFHQLLKTALANKEPSIRHAALLTLADNPSHAASFVAQAATGLEDPDPTIQDAAAKVMAVAGESGAKAADAVLKALEKSDTTRRVVLLEVIAGFGKSAAKATPRLIPYAQDENPEVRSAAINALSRLGDENARESVKTALKDKEPSVRKTALLAMGRMLKDEDHVKVLNQALKDKVASVRIAALKGLAEHRSDARPAAAGIFKALDDGETRKVALETLTRVRPRDPDRYLAAMSHDNHDVRLFACRAIGYAGRDSKEIRDALEKALRTRDRSMRRAARESLDRLNKGKKK